MSLVEKFAAIRAKPIIFCDGSFQKTGYSSQVFCDRCGLRGLKVYVSSAQTPTTDLCPTCFNALVSRQTGEDGNDDADDFV